MIFYRKFYGIKEKTNFYKISFVKNNYFFNLKN